MTEDYTMDNGDFLHSYPKVTRIEVIGKERDLVRYGCEDVQVSLQDDGQTLKVFYGRDSEDEAALMEVVLKRIAEGTPIALGEFPMRPTQGEQLQDKAVKKFMKKHSAALTKLADS